MERLVAIVATNATPPVEVVLLTLKRSKLAKAANKSASAANKLSRAASKLARTANKFARTARRKDREQNGHL